MAGHDRWAVLIGVVFVTSRALYAAAGIEFVSQVLNDFWQYVDPVLLESDLLRSLFYLHSQPPGFNLFLGVGLKLCGPDGAHAFYQICFLLLGLGTYLCMFHLLVRFGFRCAPATVLTVLFMINPTSVIYENWLFYTFPVAGLLTISTFFLGAFLKRRSLGAGSIFFLLAAIVGLSRSVFHLAWFFLIFVLVLALGQQLRRKTAIAAGFAFVLIFSVYLKNYVVFGTFSVSSWGWLSISKLAIDPMPRGVKAELIDSNRLASVAAVKAFASPSTLSNFLPIPQETGVAALDEMHKQGRENVPNFNHSLILAHSRVRMRDVLYCLRTYPRIYLNSVEDNFWTFLLPPLDNYGFLARNSTKIPSLVGFFDVFFYGQVAEPSDSMRASPAKSRPGYTVLGGLLLALLGTIRTLRRVVQNEFKATANEVLLLYVGFTALWVSVAAILLEMGEGHRMRVMVEPLLFLLVAFYIRGGIRTLLSILRTRHPRQTG